MRGRSGFSIDADGRNGTIDAVPMAPKWIGVLCVYVVIGVLLALSNRYPGIYVILTGGIWLVGLDWEAFWGDSGNLVGGTVSKTAVND